MQQYICADNHLEPMYWCCKHKKTAKFFLFVMHVNFSLSIGAFANKLVHQTLFRLSAHCLFTRTSSINFFKKETTEKKKGKSTNTVRDQYLSFAPSQPPTFYLVPTFNTILGICSIGLNFRVLEIRNLLYFNLNLIWNRICMLQYIAIALYYKFKWTVVARRNEKSSYLFLKVYC
jgi:hypothetical protein